MDLKLETGGKSIRTKTLRDLCSKMKRKVADISSLKKLNVIFETINPTN